MILSESLVKYSIAQENGEKLITYFMEQPNGAIMELGKIAVDLTFDVSNPLTLLQLFVTPHVHNSLLEAIIPFVEKIAPHMEVDTKSSLESWTLQAKSILNHPK